MKRGEEFSFIRLQLSEEIKEEEYVSFFCPSRGERQAIKNYSFSLFSRLARARATRGNVKLSRKYFLAEFHEI
jgi:hypothetical protein